MLDNEKLSFCVTWHDLVSSSDRHFLLNFYTREGEVEMIESKSKKIFLRKIKTHEVEESDLFVGNTVKILSRKLRITDYGDEETKDKVRLVQESTFALIKPSSMREAGKILQEIYANGLTVAKAKQILLTGSLASALYDSSRDQDDFKETIESLTSGPSLALVLVGENAVERWKDGLGDLIPSQEEEDDEDVGHNGNHTTIRARFGRSVFENVAHASLSVADAKREVELFFPAQPANHSFLRPTSSAVFSNSSCCVVLPHAVRGRGLGDILACVQEEGFTVSALETFHLDFGKAEEFLEIYKNVVENYGAMVKHLSSGMCCALEVVADSSPESSVQLFREFVGPRDPDIARKLRPNTLRARFGKNLTENAVHCTDLPEDGALEVEYFFKVLQ